jgi:hypothetical protein
VAYLHSAGARAAEEGLLVLGVWIIWTHRNSCVFNGAVPSVSTALQVAREEALMWTVARAKGLSLLRAEEPQGYSFGGVGRVVLSNG